MRHTTYKQSTTSWTDLGNACTDAAEAIAKVTAMMKDKAYATAFNGHPATVQLIFPKVTAAQKAAAFEWKLYVERQPLTAYREVQR